jgi:L-lactate dehydrogenase (cytochrome)
MKWDAVNIQMKTRPNASLRRFPRWGEVKPLMGFSKPTLNRTQVRLDRCADLYDIRQLAKRRVPQPVFDFVDGAAGSESSLRRSRDLFTQVEFKPRALRDVSNVDTSIDIVGERARLPFFFSPTGFTRMMHHEGEIAAARAAARAGIPYSVSTVGTTTIERITEVVPGCTKWFQLYLMSDRVWSKELLTRASSAGYSALVVTVDAPVPGKRLRDVRSGLLMPPRLTMRTIASMARRPHWCFNVLTTEPLGFAMVDAASELPEAVMARTFDPTVTIDDIHWLRSVWSGKLIVKGIQSVEDAIACQGAGADAVVLSTHGGRQLEHAPLPLELLPIVRARLDPKVQVMIDGGIMSGADIIAALALGAQAVGIGRAYLYGLMAGGQAGADRVVDLLTTELSTTLRLIGCTSINDLTPDHVRFRGSTRSIRQLSRYEPSNHDL